MEQLLRYGEDLALTGFNDGHFAGLARVFEDYANGDEGMQGAAYATILGGIVQLARVLEAAQLSGYRISPTPPTAAEILYVAASPARFWPDVARIMNTAKALQQSAPGIRASAPVPPTKREEARPAPVAEPEKPAGPIEVRVVAMPARISDTLVERNAAGEIENARRIEKDF